MKKWIFIIPHEDHIRVLVALLFFCIAIQSRCQQTKLNPVVDSFLRVALDSIRNNALNSPSVNWEKVTKEVYAMATGAEQTHQTYNALIYVLQMLKDNHSFLQRNSKNLSYPENPKEPSPYGLRMKIEYGIHEKDKQKIARVFVPQGMRDNKFAQELQRIISELAIQNPCGWIIDLRGNGGGNMWPMLAGIGHLVGDNPLGGSIKKNGEQDFYEYDMGKAIYIDPNGNRTTMAETVESPFTLSSKQPLAFLIDRGTASSGEVLAIILKGRENTKGFGETTASATTATKGFKLSDGLNLVLAVSAFQDRNGNTYLNGVMPDVEIRIGNEMIEPSTDPVIKNAIQWIITRCN